MIEKKEEIFAHGIKIFAFNYCRGDKNLYSRGMIDENGYTIAATAFFLRSGYLTKEDTDLLFNEGKIPQWMQKVFIEVEHAAFGTSIWGTQP